MPVYPPPLKKGRCFLFSVLSFPFHVFCFWFCVSHFVPFCLPLYVFCFPFSVFRIPYSVLAQLDWVEFTELAAVRYLPRYDQFLHLCFRCIHIYIHICTYMHIYLGSEIALICKGWASTLPVSCIPFAFMVLTIFFSLHIRRTYAKNACWGVLKMLKLN